MKITTLFRRIIVLALIICFVGCVCGCNFKNTSLNVVRSILEKPNYSFFNRIKGESEIIFTGRIITNDYYVAVKCANTNVCVITPSYIYVVTPLSSNIYAIKTKGQPAIVFSYTDSHKLWTTLYLDQQGSKYSCYFQLDDLYKRWSGWAASSVNENTEIYRDPLNKDKYSRLSIGSNPLFYSILNISSNFEYEFWCSQDTGKIQISKIKPTHLIEFANDNVRSQFVSYLEKIQSESFVYTNQLAHMEESFNKLINKNKDKYYCHPISEGVQGD